MDKKQDNTQIMYDYFEEAKEAFLNNEYSRASYLLEYILKYQPNNPSSNYLYGNVLYKFKKYEESIKFIEKSKDSFENKGFYNLALAESYKYIDIYKAEDFFKKTLRIAGKSPSLLTTISMFYKHYMQDYDEAQHHLALSFRNFQGQNNLIFNMGVLHYHFQGYEDAIMAYEGLLLVTEDTENDEKLYLYYNNLGNCYFKLNKLSKAILMYKKSIAHNPYLSSSYVNLGAVYKKLKRYNSAIQIYVQGLNSSSKVEVEWNLSLFYLLVGKFEQGFKLYERRLELDFFIKDLIKCNIYKKQRWQGQSLKNKTILISGEQGFGDMILFARYIKAVLNLGVKQVIFLSPPELQSLFVASFENIKVITDMEQSPNYDYYCYIMSLAYIFQTSSKTIPNSGAYLKYKDNKKNIKIDKNKFNIAIAYKTLNNGEDKKDRNIDLEQIASIFNLENVSFYSILETENNINDPLIDLSKNIKDFNDTANILNKMDLVISIDTALIHLGGALNKPCIVLIPNDSNWRWINKDGFSKWYPNTKIIKINKNMDSLILQNIQDIMKNGFNGFNDYQPCEINLENIEHNINQITNLNNKAEQLLQNSNYQDAINFSVQSLGISKNAKAFLNIGIAYLKSKNYDKAIQYFNEALFFEEIPLEIEEICFYLGVALLTTGKKEDAINAFKDAIKHNPLSIKSRYNLSSIYNSNKLYKNSIKLCEEILKIDKSEFKAIELLAFLYHQDKKLEKARFYYIQVEKKESIFPITTLNMAVFHFDDNNLKKAKKYLKKSIKQEYSLQKAYQYLGTIYKQERKITKAIFCYEKSLKYNKTDKTVNWNLGFLYLLNDEYIKGFTFLEKRYETKLLEENKNLKSEKYNNEGLNYKVLFIYMEQGFGDNIQFARYIDLIKEKYPNVTIYLQVRLELYLLFQSIKSIDMLFVSEEISEDYDYHISLFSLAYIFQTTINTVPINMPYLKSTPKDYDIALNKNKINIGITWESAKISATHKQRSIKVESFKILSENKKIQLYSLQKGQASQNLKQSKLDIIDLSPQINNFNDTANLIEKLDLIVSIDTALVHLAGAINSPCFVLISYESNWKWGFEQKKSIWYPSLKLFRMRKDGENERTFEEIISEALLIKK